MGKSTKEMKKAKKVMEAEIEAKVREKFEGQIKDLREELGSQKTENLKLMGDRAKK